MMRDADHDWLQLYLDGELDRDAARACEAHLDACAQCRAHLAELDALRRALRAAAPRHAAPAALRQRIATAAPARRMRVPWRPFALAASWAFAFVLGGLLFFPALAITARIGWPMWLCFTCAGLAGAGGVAIVQLLLRSRMMAS